MCSHRNNVATNQSLSSITIMRFVAG